MKIQTSTLAIGLLVLSTTVFCGTTDDIASGGDGKPGGGSSPGGNDTARDEPAGSGGASQTVSEAGVLQLTGDDLEDDVIDIVQWGGRGGGGESCQDRDGEFSEPGWLYTGIDSETGVASFGEYPQFETTWCACGVDDPDASIILTSPDGTQTDVTHWDEYVGESCIDGFLYLPGLVPRPGSNMVELISGGDVLLTSEFTVRYDEVNINRGLEDVYWSGGFRPGEEVQVVYYVQPRPETELPEELLEAYYNLPQFGDLMSELYSFQLAADLTHKADDDGMIILSTDASDYLGVIVGMSGASGEDFVCYAGGLKGCSPFAETDLMRVQGVTRADIIFGRAEGTLDSLYDLSSFGGGPGDGSDDSATTCPGFMVSRLEVGERGNVTPGLPNRLRNGPSFGNEASGQIPGGAGFEVLDGPVCADDTAWWQVDYNGLVGWTAEGEDNTYWLEP